MAYEEDITEESEVISDFVVATYNLLDTPKGTQELIKLCESNLIGPELAGSVLAYMRMTDEAENEQLSQALNGVIVRSNSAYN